MSNFFAGPFITAGLNQQGRAESSDKLYCIRVYVILNLFLLLSTILSLFLPTIIIKSNVKTLEGKERLLNVKLGELQFYGLLINTVDGSDHT